MHVELDGLQPFRLIGRNGSREVAHEERVARCMGEVLRRVNQYRLSSPKQVARVAEILLVVSN